MGTPSMYLTLSFLCFFMFSSMANPAENNNVCSTVNEDGKPKMDSHHFRLVDHCFEFIKKDMTWGECADYCREYGGFMAKLDENILTDDTAKEFAKSIGLQADTGSLIYVGFTTTTGNAEWIDGTKVTVPYAETMLPGLCGTLLIDNEGDRVIKYMWNAYPCDGWRRCLCEYDQLVDTTTEVPGDTTTEVPDDTTTEVPDDTTTEVPDDTTTEVPDDTTTEVPTDTTTEVPTDTTTEVPTDTTTEVTTDTTTEVSDDTTTEDPTDTTTEVPDDTTSEVPTDTTTEVPTITTRDVHLNNCTGNERTTQTNWRVGRRNGTERKSVQTVYKRTKYATYITAKAFLETKCTEVTMCPCLCMADDQCVSYNYNTATGDCRLFNNNQDQCLEEHPDWHVWDQLLLL